MINIEKAKKVFMEYISNYDMSDGKIKLKAAHILRVTELSKQIATSLNLDEENTLLAELIGLLHDIGRFEQVKRYNTFVDKDSINHGEYGVKILFEENLIEKFEIEEKYYKTIKTAILNHNRNKIEDGLNENELLHAKIIRDSDKLDIFKVLLIDDVNDTYGCSQKEMENTTFSKEIIREFKEEREIDYQKRKTYGDIWISHMAYIYDFYFDISYKVMNERNYINKFYEKIQFNKQETKEQAREIFEISSKYMKSKI